MYPLLTILFTLILPVLCASAMDRFDALSQIESQNNDYAIGRYREVSRYQILPVFWAQAVASNLTTAKAHPTDPSAAKLVVNWMMQSRCQAFQERYHRTPSDFEYYILWHRPACLIGRTIPRPITSLEHSRAQRFANLCQISKWSKA